MSDDEVSACKRARRPSDGQEATSDLEPDVDAKVVEMSSDDDDGHDVSQKANRPSSSTHSSPSSGNHSDEPIDRETLERENAEAEAAMKNFATITGTDEIYAQMILQDVNWNVEAGLEVHFARQNEREEDVEEMKEDEADSSDVVDLTGIEISLMSWNIDGLDGNSLNTRMKAVYCVVKRVNPDFVFLQEVVERGIEPIERLKKFYDIYYSNRGSLYFTAIVVGKKFIVKNHEVIHYENSGMGRTLQVLEGSIGPQKVFLLNTHLESMAEHSDRRKAQLEICLKKFESIQQAHPNSLIFFAGDLNIRDSEMMRLPRGAADAWMAAGADKKQQYTWDTRLNDNKFAGGARCRFDRVFWSGPLRNVEFELEGKQRIRTTQCFPSDHWAVHCVFK